MRARVIRPKLGVRPLRNARARNLKSTVRSRNDGIIYLFVNTVGRKPSNQHELLEFASTHIKGKDLDWLKRLKL